MNAVTSGILFGEAVGSGGTGSTGASVTFLTTDTTTHGSWRSIYGADGYTIAGDLSSNPSYVTPLITGASYYVWYPSTSDVRAPQKASNPSDRVAATWYASGQYFIDLNMTDGVQHQVALYCLDWDTTSRRQTIDVLDVNNNVLNTQTLSSSFNGGVYLVWNVTGHVKLRVTWTGGFNAVTSGLFFGGSGTQSAPPPSQSITTAISPTSINLSAAQSQQFNATVTGTSNTAVTWTASAGSISNTGYYTAPASPQTVTVTATSVADTTKSASAAVTVSAPSNASISISSPAASSKISGTVTFAVSLQNSGAVASVDYLLNGKSISGPLTSAPYSFVWPSASVWDGQMSVKAIARDILGNVLATSASLPFQIANGTSTLTLVSPNPSQVLSGVVNWTLNTNWNLSSGNPIYFFFLDGQQVWLTFTKTQTITYSLDTTKIPNGTHELYCALYAEQPSSISPPLAMSQVQVQVNNGHAVQQLRSNWRQIVLQPGQTAVLSPQWVYTDGVGTQSTTASYVSANSSVATVNSGGLVQAVAPGVTTLTATSGSYSDTTRVLVTSAATLPHFAKNGQFLNAYDPVNSTYVRSMFWLDNTEIQQTPGTAARMQEAALNTITNGFFYNPVDNSNNSTFAAWKPGMDILLNGLQQAAVTNNFNLFLTGDDIARHPNELNFSINNGWSPNPVQYAFQWAQSSGHVIGVDMVDEVDGAYGSTPTPTDGRWLSDNPSLPNNSFSRLMSVIKQVSGPPVSWPVSGAANPTTVASWQGNPAFSDFATVYWQVNDFRRAYPMTMSLWQVINDVDSTWFTRLPSLQTTKPLLLEASAMGPDYLKKGPGCQFVPGQDQMWNQGVTAAQVAAQVMMAPALGMAGVRAYAWDASYVKTGRCNATPGQTQDYQTGTDPFVTGTDRWAAMGSAMNLLKQLEPHVLQPLTNAIDLGAQIYTGAHKGPSSQVLIAINTAEVPVSVPVDVSAYQYADATSVIRYHLQSATLNTESVANDATAGGLVTFQPGETIVWLFTPPTAPAAPPVVAITSPVPESVVSGVVNIQAKIGGNPLQFDHASLFVDGILVGTSTSLSPTFTWMTNTVTSGIWHDIAVYAYDPSGHSTQARIGVSVR